jgi:hypothetical protein
MTSIDYINTLIDLWRNEIGLLFLIMGLTCIFIAHTKIIKIKDSEFDFTEEKRYILKIGIFFLFLSILTLVYPIIHPNYVTVYGTIIYPAVDDKSAVIRIGNVPGYANSEGYYNVTNVPRNATILNLFIIKTRKPHSTKLSIPIYSIDTFENDVKIPDQPKNYTISGIVRNEDNCPFINAEVKIGTATGKVKRNGSYTLKNYRCYPSNNTDDNLTVIYNGEIYHIENINISPEEENGENLVRDIDVASNDTIDIEGYVYYDQKMTIPLPNVAVHLIDEFGDNKIGETDNKGHYVIDKASRSANKYALEFKHNIIAQEGLIHLQLNSYPIMYWRSTIFPIIIQHIDRIDGKIMKDGEAARDATISIGGARPFTTDSYGGYFIDSIPLNATEFDIIYNGTSKTYNLWNEGDKPYSYANKIMHKDINI